MHEDDHYKTTDLGLASGLIAANHPLIDLRKEEAGKFTFHFTRTLSLTSDIASYWNDDLKVSAKKLLEGQKSLKSRIYSTN